MSLIMPCKESLRFKQKYVCTMEVLKRILSKPLLHMTYGIHDSPCLKCDMKDCIM